jgi:SAM-dependent methyltransferase
MSESTNFAAARAFVEFGLGEQRKGKRESASGPGSSLAAVAQTLALLDETTRELSIRRILDLGCGDWNWMKEAHWYRSMSGIEYAVWEASPELVDQLERRFGRPDVSFHLKDIVEEAFPPADLLICRDVLFHLPTALALLVVNKAMKTGGFLLATTFPNQSINTDIKAYLPIKNWGFCQINLDLPPFNLVSFLRRQVIEPLCGSEDVPRAVCLYDFSSHRRDRASSL